MIAELEKRLDEQSDQHETSALRMISDLEGRLSDRIHNNRDATLSAINELKETVKTNRIADKEAVMAALVSAKEAVTKAESANESRFASMNEFRGSLADQARLQMPRLEAEALLKALTEKMDTYARGVTNRMDTLTQQMTASAGKKAGMTEGWGYAVGAVGLVLAILSIVALFWKMKG
jgi:phosphopantetheinyl transferase (holo-ACP synthase)